MSKVSDLLDGLFTNLLKDEAGVLQPVADSYLTSIVSNPAPDNVIAQSIAFQAQALAALPNVEAAAAKDTAAALKAFIDAQVPALIAAQAAPVSNAVPAVPPGSV